MVQNLFEVPESFEPESNLRAVTLTIVYEQISHLLEIIYFDHVHVKVKGD